MIYSSSRMSAFIPGTRKYFNNPQFLKASMLGGSLVACISEVSCSLCFQMTLIHVQHTNFTIRTHGMARNIITYFEENLEHEFGPFSIPGFYFSSLGLQRRCYILPTEHRQCLRLQLPEHRSLFLHGQGTYDALVSAEQSVVEDFSR